MNEVILEGSFVALSDLHIGTGKKKGNFHPTETHVTAKALRGMLGTYLYHYDRELFKESKIGKYDSAFRFFPSYPSGSIPVPSNLKWCKKCGRLLEKDGGACPEDGNEGTRKSGLFKMESLKNKMFESAEDLGKTIHAKVPITRSTGTSPKKEDKLKPYNIEVFGKGVAFDFMMKCPEKMADKISEYLTEAGLIMGVGGFRSRGMGTIFFKEIRVKSLEDKKKELMKDMDEELLLLVTSPVIIKNENGYIIGFDKHSLQTAGLPVIAVKQKFSRYIKGYARGWNYASDVYKLEEMVPATAPGSAYFVRINPEDVVNGELNGIGENREIYGHIKFFGGVRIESE